MGRNELVAIDVCRAYVEAQLEYASRDRDANGVLEYAQRIVSSPGKKDGLYEEGRSVLGGRTQESHLGSGARS